MKDWFSINLGDAMLAQEPLDQIKEALLSACASADKPDDVAAFMRHESNGHLHCEVKVYLSPGAAVVARKFAATPCSKPSPNDLSLLLGSGDSWHRFFLNDMN